MENGVKTLQCSNSRYLDSYHTIRIAVFMIKKGLSLAIYPLETSETRKYVIIKTES